MATFVVVLVFSKLLLNSILVQAATHWVVTEDGRIQAQLDSVFNMRRPYDLMSMLKQEERSKTLGQLKTELIERKEEIDKNEDKDTGLEKRFYETDPDCIVAGKPLPEYDLYISTVLPLENKGIKPEEFIDFKAVPSTAPMAPDCTKIGVKLEYSPHAFEHLQGMKERANLTGNPELGLKNAITHRDNVDDYGHLVYQALLKEKESWVLYNMAAFYWRIKGDPYHVIECVRRALHFSPRMQKDVALISLANVLHRAHFSNEAAIVVHAALDVSRELNVNHFTLGNIYAVLRDYNKSVICFENTLKIQPDFEAAAKRKHAVLCHAKLEVALEKQHSSLQRTLDDLKDYQKKHEYWQQQQEWLLSEQASPDTRFDQKVTYEEFKAREIEVALGYGEYCKMESTGDKMYCGWGKKHVYLSDADFKPNRDSMYADENAQVDYMNPIRPPLYPAKHPVTPEVLQKLPFKKTDWPDKEECDTYVQKFPAWNEHRTTYLSPENKGFEVKALLAEAQGLEKGVEHPLPWYPPVCATLTDIPEGPRSYDHIESVKDRTKIPLRLFDTTMKLTLLDHVDGTGMTEEEVGQRILTALKKKIGPSWVLYNLAGLYWRIYGNNYHGIECIRRALYFAPAEYQDVPLVNLANILYKWGRVEDAVRVMRDAIAVSDLEPDSHFFLGNLLAAKGNISGSVHHYEEALSQHPLHGLTFESLRIIKCYQKFHSTQQSKAPKSAEGDNCGNKAGVGETESRVICRNENGKETCTVETKPNGCDACKQMCTVTTVPMKSCGKEIFKDAGLDNNGIMCQDGKCEFVDQNSELVQPGNAEQCKNEGTPQYMPISDNLGNNPLSEEDFGARLDDISDYYRQKGVCTGDECHKLMLQCFTPFSTQTGVMYVRNNPIYIRKYPKKNSGPLEICVPKDDKKHQENIISTHNAPLPSVPQAPAAIKYHKPHTKLEILNGVLHQKLIFVDSSEDLIVDPKDCIIFNSGEKSEGCEREEFKPFKIDDIIKDPISVKISGIDGLNAPDILEATKKQHSELERSLNKLLETTNSLRESLLGKETKAANQEPKPANQNEQHKPNNKPQPKTANQNEAKAPPMINKESPITGKKKLTDEEIIKFNPDASRNIAQISDFKWPEFDWCKAHYRSVNFKQFLSTWVSVTTKGVDVKEHIDFDTPVKLPFKSPVCDLGLLKKPLPLDLLDGIKAPNNLQYGPETGLRESLRKIGGRLEGVNDVGTRIAIALEKKPSSWVLTNLAALYWRVQGDAPRAVECNKLAYEFAPSNAKDISLLSLANILFRSDQTDDAIKLTNVALERAPELVVTHFTMANLFAAKWDWGKATQFYQSTLGLQASFKPAKERLVAILCEKVLSNPHVFKPSEYKETVDKKTKQNKKKRSKK